METQVHETAIVHKGVQLGEGVSVGPFSIVKAGVKLGNGVKLVSHVIVEGDTEIGEGTTVHPFASIGLAPQDLKYKGEETRLVIGKNNLIREYVTIHRASTGGSGVTTVGDGNFLMAYCHIAHDCKIGSQVVMANVATLGGHVSVGDFAVLGGLCAVHQHTRIGSYCMVGGLSAVAQDIPPYMMASGIASGAKVKLYGINSIGLKRNGFSEQQISELKQAYMLLFRGKLKMKDAVRKVQEELPYTDELRHLIEFLSENKRGICR